MGVASATVRREGEAKRKKKGARSNRERRVRPTFPSGRTGPLSGDRRNCGNSARDARRGEPSRATRVRFARANAVIDAVGSDSRRFARRFASRARVRAVRRPPNIGQQRISRFKLQIEARGKRQRERGRARAERRHRSAASERARQLAASRGDTVARARWGADARASRASRGPARGRMARRYATREGSSAQIPAMSRVCQIATRARARVDRARGAASCRTCASGHPRKRRTIVVVGCVDELRAETRVSVIERTTMATLSFRCENQQWSAFVWAF